MNRWGSALLLAIGGLSFGCSATVRDANAYRDATRALLEAKNPDIKSCYDSALSSNAATSGSVVVNFKVEAETGKVVEPKIDAAKSTAPASLQQCVLRAVAGVALEPPDSNEGHATFQWEFKPKA